MRHRIAAPVAFRNRGVGYALRARAAYEVLHVRFLVDAHISLNLPINNFWQRASGRGGSIVVSADDVFQTLFVVDGRIRRGLHLRVGSLSAAYDVAPVRFGVVVCVLECHVVNHALRNAWLPVVTMIGLEFGFLLGGVVVIETVFSWPGIGRLVFNAINQRDIPVVQASVIVLSVIFITLNLIVDLIYVRIDPRVKL